MDTRAAIASAGVAMDPPDVVNELTIGGGSRALRARAPGIIAGRRDPEHVAHDRHRIVVAVILDEAESHVRAPAKIAIDFFKMSRSMRSRSFSSLQTGDLRRVVRRRQRRLRGGAPRRRRRLPPGPTLLHPPPQHGIAQAEFLGHRPDRTSARCHQINRLPLVVVRKRPTSTSFHPTPPGSSSLLQVSINSEEVHTLPFSPCGRRWRGHRPRRMRGLYPRRQAPHPSRCCASTPSPQGERGRKSCK